MGQAQGGFLFFRPCAAVAQHMMSLAQRDPMLQYRLARGGTMPCQYLNRAACFHATTWNQGGQSGDAVCMQLSSVALQPVS